MPNTSPLGKWFKLDEHGTTVPRELRAGLVTFLTMAYIVVVNPAILSAAGMPRDAAMTATILTVIFGTALMAVVANRPFAVAPLMGENAFVAFTVCKVMGYPWQAALAGILISASLITVLSITGARKFLMEAIPINLKYSLAVGIGFFLTFIGFNETGIVSLGVPGAPLHLGKISSAPVLLSVFGFVLMALLILRRIPGGLLLGIVATTIASFIFGITKLPEHFVGVPPSIAPTLFKFDFKVVLTVGFFPVLLTLFLMDFLDMMGSLIGCSSLAGFLDEEGNLPNAQKPLFVDSFASVFGACVGTTTAGTYIESAAGIQEGGRTGLTALTVSVLFALCLFLAPFLTVVPPQAYGPALILVGIFMISPITKINFSDYTELIPAFFIIALMSFTYNIGVGLIAGFVLYPIGKLVTLRHKEVSPGMWILFVLSVLFFVFYKY
ncbi:MAG: NCS2 family permease [Candidatus Eisenbacteria bacterium]